MTRSRRTAMILACAVALAGPAHADDGDAGTGKRGDVELVVFVTGAPGVPLPAVRRVTLQVSMERALKRDPRLIVIDEDDRLAARAGRVPAEVVAEARALVTSGEALLRRGQAGAALLKLEGASVQLARVLAWTQKQELARAQFLVGAARALAGDARGATATFVALLAWRPDMVADAEIEPTKILPLWEKARKQARRLDGGSIELETDPGGALAYVDGKLVGFTPSMVEGLSVGVHYVTVRREGHERRVEPVTVSNARPARLELTLAPSPGAAEVAAAERALASGLGEATTPPAAQRGLAVLGARLDVEHVVALVALPGDGRYQAYVYATDGGTRLAAQSIEVGEAELEDAFATAVVALYAQVAKAQRASPVRAPARPARAGRRLHTRWWFWAGVGAVTSIAIGVPLVRSLDRGGPACPDASSCGTVVFRF